MSSGNGRCLEGFFSFEKFSSFIFYALPFVSLASLCILFGFFFFLGGFASTLWEERCFDKRAVLFEDLY